MGGFFYESLRANVMSVAIFGEYGGVCAGAPVCGLLQLLLDVALRND